MEATSQSAPVNGADLRQNDRKRQFQGERGAKRQRTRKEKPIQEGSSQEILLADVRALFAAQQLADPVVDSTSKPAKALESAESESRSAERK